uniref:Uncharacterized protein n=1 Tax=Arion vulgaris TaxID=1028688 RepID=A0A0B7A5M2_9EUPU
MDKSQDKMLQKQVTGLSSQVNEVAPNLDSFKTKLTKSSWQLASKKENIQD